MSGLTHRTIEACRLQSNQRSCCYRCFPVMNALNNNAHLSIPKTRRTFISRNDPKIINRNGILTDIIPNTSIIYSLLDFSRLHLSIGPAKVLIPCTLPLRFNVFLFSGAFGVNPVNSRYKGSHCARVTVTKCFS